MYREADKVPKQPAQVQAEPGPFRSRN